MPEKVTIVPVPDPTVLTTQALLHEIETSQTLAFERMDGNRRVFEERFDGMDKAIELLQKVTDRFPSEISASTDRLEKLHSEKFNSIATSFVERDKAVTAAMAAQEKQAIASNDNSTKANEKTELNFSELLKQGRELLVEFRRTTERDIGDIKSRLDKGEGRGSVADPQITEALRGLTTAVGNLQKTATETGARANVSDPIVTTTLAALTNAVSELKSKAEQAGGKSEGAGGAMIWLATGIAAVASIGAIIVVVVDLATRH